MKATRHQIALWHRMWETAMDNRWAEFNAVYQEIKSAYPDKVCWKHNDERRAGDGYFNVGMAWSVMWRNVYSAAGF